MAWNMTGHLLFIHFNVFNLSYCSNLYSTMKEEIQHVQIDGLIGLRTNKLQINITQTKELVFRRPYARHFSASQPIPFI